MSQRKCSIISSKSNTREKKNNPRIGSEKKKDVLAIPHTKSRLFPAAHSVSMVQTYRTNYQTESVKKSTLKILRKNLKHIFSQLHTCKALSIMPPMHQ